MSANLGQRLTLRAGMAGLEMKTACERCGGVLGAADVVYICSYECTFCRACSERINHLCPNCGGELVRRRRRRQSTLVAPAADA